LQAVSRLVRPDVEIRLPDGGVAEDVVHTHYRSACDTYFVLNVSEKASRRVRISIRGSGKLGRVDTATGKIYEVDAKSRDGRLEFSMRLEPTESMLILRSSRLPASARSTGLASKPRPKRGTIRLGRKWDFRTLKPNILPLHEWEVKVGSGPERWAASTVRYRTRFSLRHVPKNARLLLDGAVADVIFGGSGLKPARAELNGTPLLDRRGRPFRPRELSRLLQRGNYLDPYIPEYDVADVLKKGLNRLEILTMGSLHEPATLTQPAYLIGDFILKSGSDGRYATAAPRDSIETGSWCTQGYPFYSGIGEYVQEVEVPAFERAFIRFRKVADLVEVVVNGRRVDVLAWEPFEAEISGALKRGRNIITLRAANTMSNLFQRSMRPSGVLSDVLIDLY